MIISMIKYGMKSRIHSQISMVQSVKSGNGYYVNQSNASPGMWLLIHTGYELVRISKEAPGISFNINLSSYQLWLDYNQKVPYVPSRNLTNQHQIWVDIMFGHIKIVEVQGHLIKSRRTFWMVSIQKTQQKPE